MTLVFLRSLFIAGFWLATGTQTATPSTQLAWKNPPRHSPLATLGNLIAQADSNSAARSSCPSPALSRLVQHRTQTGDTPENLARRYKLIPATLIGMNPVLSQNQVPVGSLIVIPPYNGIRVEVPSGQSLQEIAATYNVRADVLFEVNGCQSAPQVVFVPGVNGSPNPTTPDSKVALAPVPGKGPYRYPLPMLGPVLRGYGWQIEPKTGEVTFHGGVDLKATTGTQVFSAAEGTVAFAGDREDYGNLVVVNHSSGHQTRYAQLATIAVSVGAQVKQGEVLGTVGATGAAEEPHLHFEMRTNSALGWVAQNPSSSFETLRGFKQIKTMPSKRTNSGL